jgi:hypothetical protein
MRGVIIGSLSLLLGVFLPRTSADDFSAGVRLARPVPVTPAGQPSPPNSPLVTLGRPVAIRSDPANGPVTPVSYNSATSAPYVARGQSPDLPGVPPLAAPPPVNPGPASAWSEPYKCGSITQDASTGFWAKCKNLVSFDAGPGRNLFQSDHAFDGFISPVTNPFFFEDPRSLTEIRPIAIFQGTPTRNAVYRGGDIEFFGVQARLALTERFSIVMNKLGFIWSEPHNPDADFQNHFGFTELNIGPKYTFLRSENTGTLGALGLNFQIPIGNHNVFQDTGSLTLEPYLSLGQSFCKSSYGAFNALGTIGYNFGIDSNRTDSFFTSLHLDYDIGNLHRIYPFMELNYLVYTANGKSRDLNFEGRDLFNFGSQHVSGHNDFSFAAGARYKVLGSDHIQLGLAAEVPLTGRKDLQDYRVIFDVIFRY